MFQGCGHSPVNLNLYVDYGNISHFAVKVWTFSFKGRLDTDRNIRPIWAEWAACASWYLCGPNFYNKMSHISIYIHKFGLNGQCHVLGTFCKAISVKFRCVMCSRKSIFFRRAFFPQIRVVFFGTVLALYPCTIFTNFRALWTGWSWGRSTKWNLCDGWPGGNFLKFVKK